jgi:hypothetical protein
LILVSKFRVGVLFRVSVGVALTYSPFLLAVLTTHFFKTIDSSVLVSMNYRILIAVDGKGRLQQLGPLEKCQVFMVVLMAVLINEFSEGQKPF